MRTAFASVALAAIGIALLLLVASTAGPPDGFKRFSGDHDVHVYLRDDMRIRLLDQRDIVVNASSAGDTIEVASVPTVGRSLSAYVRFTRAGFPGGARIRSDKSVDVDGADEARELRIDYPDIEAKGAYVIARRDGRFYTLIAIDSRPGGNPLDLDTVVDSFFLS